MQFFDLYRDAGIPEWPNYRWPARKINGPHQVKLHPQAEDLTWEDWAFAIRYYYAFTTLIDQQIGRIVAHLDKTGLRDNTIIIFTADHGETLGSHGGLYDKGWHHFEEIQRVPFIVWVPKQLQGSLKSGTVLKEWVSLADVYPTVLDLAAADYPPDAIHGRSLVPLLKGERVEWRDKVFVEFNGVNSLATSMVSMRLGDLKYGWNCSNFDELYDLAHDPFETRNLIDDPAHSGHVREMRELIAEWMGETGYPGLRMYRRSRMGVRA